MLSKFEVQITNIWRWHNAIYKYTIYVYPIVHIWNCCADDSCHLLHISYNTMYGVTVAIVSIMQHVIFKYFLFLVYTLQNWHYCAMMSVIYHVICTKFVFLVWQTPPQCVSMVIYFVTCHLQIFCIFSQRAQSDEVFTIISVTYHVIFK